MRGTGLGCSLRRWCCLAARPNRPHCCCSNSGPQTRLSCSSPTAATPGRATVARRLLPVSSPLPGISAAAAKFHPRRRRARREGGVDTARCPLSRISRRPTPILGLIPPCARTRLRCAPTLAQWQKQAIPADTLGVQGPGMHGAGLPGIDKVFPLASESGGMGGEENVCVCSRGFCILEMQSRLRAGSRAGM